MFYWLALNGIVADYETAMAQRDARTTSNVAAVFFGMSTS
jgi:hypothetical protein